MLSLNELNIPLLLLYAEIHYRFFPLFPSLLYKREPEVLFDVPHRIGPGEDLPILLIINDILRFPAEPLKVGVTVSQPSHGTRLHQFIDLNNYEVEHPFKKLQRAFLFPIPGTELPTGELFINATVTLKNSKKSWIVFNDNLNTSSKKAFRCFHSDTSLPGNELCTYGDIHVHSQFSQSHVEFGPPLAVIDKMAKSCGLSFIGITDHSYDLSCKMDDYLNEDQSLERWKCQINALADCSTFSTILLQGEEISCWNSLNDTVHLGALGITDFIPGSADGARQDLKFRQQLTIKQAVNDIRRQGGISFAAHPCSLSGLLQKLFLHRGHWSERDLEEHIDGIQILNNGFGKSWVRGKELWIKLLQQGKKLPLLAGNDAHGDFSRYRAIKMPFLSIYENFQRFMGYGMTGIFGLCTTGEQIMDGIRNGCTFITTGPYISINYSNDPKDSAIGISSETHLGEQLFLHSLSTPEFGSIRKVTVLSGTSREKDKEKIVFITNIKERSYDISVPISFPSLKKGDYLRAEVESIDGAGTTYHAYTSCCFITD